MQRIVVCLAAAAGLLAALSAPAKASISRAELDELVDKGVSAAVLASLIEKHCVDFEVDDRTRSLLAPRVAASVMRALAGCAGGAQRAEPAAPAPAVADSSSAAAARRPAAAAPANPPPPGVARIAVVPITLDGAGDLEITSMLIEKVREHAKGAQVIDPFALGMHFGDPDSFNAEAPRADLLAAARRAGATHMVVARAFKYHQFQDFAVRVEVDLDAVGDGETQWQGRGRGSSGNRSWSSAKRRAVIDIVRKMPSEIE